ELEVALGEAGIPCSRVNNFKEVLEHPHSVARNLVQDIAHPRLGPMRAVRNPILLDHDGPEFQRHAPLLGEHSAEILAELGYAPTEIDALMAQRVTLGPPHGGDRVAAE